MNSLQIDKILKGNCHSKKYFIGVFSSNNIPLHSIYPHCFIANTDKKGTKGQHWVAFYVKNSELIEYFDSFGDKPNSDIANYLANYSKIKSNKEEIQSVFSNSCGFYCIYFIINKCLGVKFDTIIKTLLRTKNHSDLLVKFFVKYLLEK